MSSPETQHRSADRRTGSASAKKSAPAENDKRLESAVREMIAFESGEPDEAVSEVSETMTSPDIAGIRHGLGYSQDRFATALGIPVATLRNWEQGRRKPTNASQMLLRAFALAPEAVTEAAGGTRARREGGAAAADLGVGAKALVDQVAAEAGLPAHLAEAAIQAVFSAITTSLQRGKEVKLVGFGSFSVTDRKAHDPETGAELDLTLGKVPKFTAGKDLKDALS
jgi:DNA-binding protein HU-beta